MKKLFLFFTLPLSISAQAPNTNQLFPPNPNTAIFTQYPTLPNINAAGLYIHHYELIYETNWVPGVGDPTNITIIHQAGHVFSHTNIVFYLGTNFYSLEVPDTKRWVDVDCLPQRTIAVGNATIRYHGKQWSIPTKQ